MASSALIGGVVSAHAQTFGAKAGATWSNVTFDLDDAPFDSRDGLGWLAGGFLEFPLAGRLSLQADVLFVERRMELADAPESEPAFTDALRYLEIPVVARYHLFNWSGVRFAAEGGVGFSFLLSARETFAGGDDDISDAIESQELGAVAGGAVEWRRLVVGVRYLFGLSDVYREEFFPAHLRTLQVAVGYRF